jgi:hypothetical protein
MHMTAASFHHRGTPKSRVRRRRARRRPMLDAPSDLDDDEEVEIGGGDEQPDRQSVMTSLRFVIPLWVVRGA